MWVTVITMLQNAIEQIVKRMVISNSTMLVCRHCNYNVLYLKLGA